RREAFSTRSTDEPEDYRHFPEPDLPPLHVKAAWIAEIRAALPELPEARTTRLVASYGLSEYDADVIVRLDGAEFFEAMVRAGAPAKASGNWLQGEVRRKLKEINAEDLGAMPFDASALAELVTLTERGIVSSTVAKQIFETMWTTGKRAQTIVDEEGLAQIGDESALAALVVE